MPTTKSPDYYRILGIKRNADDKQIRQAFRELARKYHPDLNPDNERAESNFKAVNEAYAVLSDPDSRRKYDLYGDNWKHADQMGSNSERSHGHSQSWGGNIEDLFQGGFGNQTPGFGDMFGNFGHRRGTRKRQPSRVETSVILTLEEAYTGSNRMVAITVRGKTRRLQVDIPCGVDTGSVVKFNPGNDIQARINVTITPHKRFTRKGADLYLHVEAPLEDMILGGQTQIQTVDEKLELTIPPGSQAGQNIRLSKKGMPRLDSKAPPGDLYVVIQPKLPTTLTDAARSLFENLREINRNDNSAQSANGKPSNNK